MTKIYLFPGQGAQQQGMGRGLFDLFPQYVQQADLVLEWSVRDVCLNPHKAENTARADTMQKLMPKRVEKTFQGFNNPDQILAHTQVTQPVMYVVNALALMARLKEDPVPPDFVAGHSVGEYSALYAAGVFDFVTGLRLVKRRGELMGILKDGGMAAVHGMTAEKINEVLSAHELTTLDLANFNTPEQVVISGPKKDIQRAGEIFLKSGAGHYIVLNVGCAFHSRYMREIVGEFKSFIKGVAFLTPRVPVIANVSGLPYPGDADAIKNTLVRHITSPVLWSQGMTFLLSQQDPQFHEIGPGKVLTGLLRRIRQCRK
ncbi:MAG: acyltransferase domain-containing protein [Deltaproteobacteria bacterium]|nr:acyltransferase domain-containing protein [Deltaproteobacteria bacterium]